jgi:hypothetical protein
MGVADPLEFKPPPLPEIPNEDEFLDEPVVVPAPHPMLSEPYELPPMTQVLSSPPPPPPAPPPPPPPPPKPVVPPANPREHEELIAAERGAGKTWPDIAKMIPGSNPDMLRKHYNSKMKPKVGGRACLEGIDPPGNGGGMVGHDHYLHMAL